MKEAARTEYADVVSKYSLNRIAPLAVWAAEIDDPQEYRKIIAAETELTHPNPLVIEAAFTYGQAIRYLLTNTDMTEKASKAFEHAERMARQVTSAVDKDGESIATWLALARAKAEEHAAGGTMDCDVLREAPLRGEDDEDLVKQSFVLAFYFLLRHGNGCSYEDAVRETIRLGDETDTNACIVGGLLGAAVGIDDVPEDLRIKVLGFDSASKSLAKP